MIGVIFNHDIFDEPYKQSSVEKGLSQLEDLCKKLNEKLFTSCNNMVRYGITGNDNPDDYVIVHYSSELTDSAKSELANCIKECLTVKKTAYKDGNLPEILIVFSKVPQKDCFCFNTK